MSGSISPPQGDRGLRADPIRIGRYTLHDEIASGGMARVYFGRMAGAVGFSKVVAIKRMHAHFTADPDFRAMFLDEATLASRITHPNVVGLLDVVEEGSEILIVMEYVRGESLSALMRVARRRGERIPVAVAVAVMMGALAGLHAAHDAKSEQGEPLGIVHRDVSPHNVLVGVDGVPRISDFGVAKAIGRAQVTRGDTIKGKLAYMSPERLGDGGRNPIDRRADVFSAAVVLWEMLAGERLFQADDAAGLIAQVIATEVPSLRSKREDVPAVLDEVIKKALAREPMDRFASAEDFAVALETAAPRIASGRAVGEWVRAMASEVMNQRDGRVAEIERSDAARDASRGAAHPSAPPFAAVAWGAIPPADPSSAVGAVERADASGPSAMPSASSSYSAAGSLALTTPPPRGLNARLLVGTVVAASILGIVLGAAAWFANSSRAPEEAPTPSAVQAGSGTTPRSEAPPPDVAAPPSARTVADAPGTTLSSGSPTSARLPPSARSSDAVPPAATPAATMSKPKAPPSSKPTATPKPPKPQGAYLPDAP